MISFEKIVYLVLMTIIMTVVMILVNSETVVVPMSIAYISSLGAYLAIDLAAMIKETSLRPPRDFKPMKKYRYILSLVFVLGLFLLASYREIQAAMASFGIAAIVILGMLMGGIQGNKMATGDYHGPTNHNSTGAAAS